MRYRNPPHWPRITHAVALVTLIAAPAIALAQNCDKFLDHGLRNLSVSSNDEASSYFLATSACGKKATQLSERTKRDLEANAGFKLFSAKVRTGTEADRFQAALDEWCNERTEKSSAEKAAYVKVEQFQNSAIDAWTRCNELKARMIYIDPQVDGDGRNVNIQLRDGSGVGTLRLISYGGDNMRCQAEVAGENGTEYPDPAKRRVNIPTTAMYIACSRNAPARVTKEGFEYLHYPRASVTVKTEGGQFTMAFPQEWEPTLPTTEILRIDGRLGAADARIASLEQRLAGEQAKVAALDTLLEATKSQLAKRLDTTDATVATLDASAVRIGVPVRFRNKKFSTCMDNKSDDTFVVRGSSVIAQVHSTVSLKGFTQNIACKPASVEEQNWLIERLP